MPRQICSDPFQHHKKKVIKSLRSVTSSMIEHKLVKTGDLVCDTCRKELLNKIKTLESSTSSEDAVETDSESCVSLEDSEVGSELMDEAAMENSKSFLNSVLPLFGESPVKKSKFKNRTSI